MPIKDTLCRILKRETIIIFLISALTGAICWMASNYHDYLVFKNDITGDVTEMKAVTKETNVLLRKIELQVVRIEVQLKLRNERLASINTQLNQTYRSKK